MGFCPKPGNRISHPPQQNWDARLSIALAILFPMDVFPTPGGPTKHMIFPWTEPGQKLFRLFTFLENWDAGPK